MLTLDWKSDFSVELRGHNDTLIGILNCAGLVGRHHFETALTGGALELFDPDEHVLAHEAEAATEEAVEEAKRRRETELEYVEAERDEALDARDEARDECYALRRLAEVHRSNAWRRRERVRELHNRIRKAERETMNMEQEHVRRIEALEAKLAAVAALLQDGGAHEPAAEPAALTVSEAEIRVLNRAYSKAHGIPALLELVEHHAPGAVSLGDIPADAYPALADALRAGLPSEVA